MMSAVIKSQMAIRACVKIKLLFILQFVMVIYIARGMPRYGGDCYFICDEMPKIWIEKYGSSFTF